MNMRKSLLFLLCVGFLVCFATACGFDDSTEGESSNEEDSNEDTEEKDTGLDGEQSITIFEQSEIPTLDSAHAHDSVGFSTLNNINEGLYRGDENHTPQLALAEDHEVNEDETVHTFTLRDATWSNGEPVTAHDF